MRESDAFPREEAVRLLVLEGAKAAPFRADRSGRPASGPPKRGRGPIYGFSREHGRV